MVGDAGGVSYQSDIFDRDNRTVEGRPECEEVAVSSEGGHVWDHHPRLVLYLHLLGVFPRSPLPWGGRPSPSPFIATHRRSRKTSGPLQIDLRGLRMPDLAHPVTDGKLLASPHIPFTTTFLQLFNLPLYRDVDKLSSRSMREEGGPCKWQVQARQPPSFPQYPLSLPILSEIREPPFRISPG